jgi:hypothetical protein
MPQQGPATEVCVGQSDVQYPLSVAFLTQLSAQTVIVAKIRRKPDFPNQPLMS